MVERGREDRKRIRMRTYRNLYAEFISDENIILAIKNFSKGKKRRNKVRKILADLDTYIPKIREYAINFTPFEHKPKEIYDGISRKKRKIVIPTVMESIVHHMIVNVLKPMFNKGMYEHSYGSVPKRGGAYGKKCICKWIRQGGKTIKYCYKLDVKQFYASIPQDKLIEKLKSKIKDFKFMRIVENVIYCVPNGLPLGFCTSVWFANWYLSELDHEIKSLGIELKYARYVDDMAIFCASKKKLHQVKAVIDNRLAELGLIVKVNWQIFRFHYLPRNPYVGKNGKPATYGRPLDFMGYKFYRNRTTLRKTILKKIRAKAVRIWQKTKVTIFDSKQMVSALAWIKNCDIYDYYREHIKPFIDFGKLKHKISTVDRKARCIEYDRIQARREYAIGQAA
jgi:retron-type reverse transcriptase